MPLKPHQRAYPMHNMCPLCVFKHPVGPLPKHPSVAPIPFLCFYSAYTFSAYSPPTPHYRTKYNLYAQKKFFRAHRPLAKKVHKIAYKILLQQHETHFLHKKKVHKMAITPPPSRGRSRRCVMALNTPFGHKILHKTTRTQPNAPPAPPNPLRHLQTKPKRGPHFAPQKSSQSPSTLTNPRFCYARPVPICPYEHRPPPCHQSKTPPAP